MLKQPMLAHSKVPDLDTIEYPCYIQPKLDGIRCLMVDGVAYSRKMKPIPNLHIQECLKGLHGLDGELMVNGDFNKVQSAVMSIEGTPDFYYVVYDKWDYEAPYKARQYEVTDTVLGLNSKYVCAIDSGVVNNAQEASSELEYYLELGYEGAIIRSFDSPYKQGRSTAKEGYLLKLKKFDDSEATVVGFVERLHNTNTKERDERGYAKRSTKKEGMVPSDTLGALVLDWNGVTVECGTGFDDAQRKEIWENRDKYLDRLVTFKYQGVSAKGVPRFPIYKGWRLEYE